MQEPSKLVMDAAPLRHRVGSRASAAGAWALCLVAATGLGSGCSRDAGATVAADPGGATAGAGAAAVGAAKNATEKPRVLVRLGAFERGAISTRLSVAADLEARFDAHVYPEVTGIVREIRHREGESVAAGEVVVALTDDTARLAKDNKELLVSQARTKLELSTVALREAESVVEQKSVLLEKARKEWGRVSELGGTGRIISPEESDQKRYAVSQAELDLAASRLAVERSRLEEEQARQSLSLAQTDLETARLELERRMIRSPIDGVISILEPRPGELVGSSTEVFSVVGLSRLEAKVYVPQRELRRLEVGQDVHIRCEVYPDAEEPFRGKVSVINPVIDAQSGTVRVIVEVDDPTARLRPGMFIDADIITETRQDALLVSKKAILYEGKEPVVFLVGDDLVARRFVVTTALTSQTHLEVVALRRWPEASPPPGSRDPEEPLEVREAAADGSRVELAAGRLVLVGQNKLEDGSPVEIEAAGSDPSSRSRQRDEDVLEESTTEPPESARGTEP